MSSLGDPSHFDDLSITNQITSKEVHTQEDIVVLHRQVKYLRRTFWLLETQWKDLINTETRLNTLMRDEDSSAAHPTGIDGLKWQWRHLWNRKISRLFGVVAACLSLILFWSEITLMAPIDLSPFSHLIRYCISVPLPVAVQIFSLIPLGYLTACSSFGLWRLRLSKYYHMHGMLS